MNKVNKNDIMSCEMSKKEYKHNLLHREITNQWMWNNKHNIVVPMFIENTDNCHIVKNKINELENLLFLSANDTTSTTSTTSTNNNCEYINNIQIIFKQYPTYSINPDYLIKK